MRNQPLLSASGSVSALCGFEISIFLLPYGFIRSLARHPHAGIHASMASELDHAIAATRSGRRLANARSMETRTTSSLVYNRPMRMLFSTVRRLRSRMNRDAPESSPCCNDPANRGLIARDSRARRSCARSSLIASFFPPMTGPR